MPIMESINYNCEDCIDCSNCINCFNCKNCHNCEDCKDCFDCNGLINKSNYYHNKKYDKKDYKLINTMHKI